MVSTTHYLYPWDVIGDPGAVESLREAGAQHVALAVAYHAVRAMTPSHPRHRHVMLPRTTVLLPATATYPDGLAPDHAPEHDWRRAADLLTAAGLTVSAWAVLTHVDGLENPTRGRRVTAFDDVLDFSLCPSAPSTHEYVEALIGEVAGAVGGASLVLESVAAMGWRHASGHDKTTGRSSAETDAALSLCFCVHCSTRMCDAGVDVSRVRSRIRSMPVGGGALPELLGEDADALRALRMREAADALAHVQRLVPAAFAVQATAADPWYAGPAVTVDLADGLEHVTLIASAWDGDEQAIRRRDALSAAHPRSRTAAFIPLLGATTSTAVDRIGRLASSGFDELHLYHFGLLTPHERKGLVAVQAAADRWKETRRS
ncbi:hypothetical protein ACFWHT_10845 [Microbacterium sp. NPDC058342]|uniref:hypothetical protein n=1 Tax=Microbacterium sp. NPDC058342 TaxID=3346454 RepID=UPI0036548575